MDTNRWNKVKNIFNKACELPPDDRQSFIKNVCQGDAELESEVNELIKADSESSTLFDGIPDGSTFFSVDESPYLSISDHIGPYKIISELGRGGMGVVYLAERADKQFKKRLAIKLVKRGMDTDEILTRFRHERQILASLEHPNIARLYDGGATDDGRPYLVMEFVEGESITTYCENRKLTIEQRLRLFATVCKGVQYAHQNLIVHRDLKPSNVMVTKDGDIRLLDFGIAKLLQDTDDDDRAYTKPWARRVTPQYASPEQLKGERITTASDVYSLGIILYELLTGTHPYKNDEGENTFGLPDTSKWIESPASRILKFKSDEAFKARQTTHKNLYRYIKNEIETIILTALHPDIQQRYQSAEQLLRDIERFFSGHPISARPATRVYRMKKFVSRNKAATVSAITIFILTLLFAVFTWMQGEQIAQERDRAQIERDKAQEVAEFLENLLSTANPAFGTERADTMRMREFVTKSTETIRQELVNQPVRKAQMLNVLGKVHQSLGMLEQSHNLLEESLNLRIDLFGEQHHEVAESQNDLGVVLGKMGDFETAESMIRQALEKRTSIFGEIHDDVSSSITDLANIVHTRGDFNEAETLYRKALAVNTELYGHSHRKVAIATSNLATILHRKGNHREAEELHRQALAMYEELFGGEHPLIASSFNNLGLVLADLGSLDEAEALLHRALTLRQTIYGEAHPEALTSLNNLATIVADKGDYETAKEYYELSLTLRKKVYGEHSMELSVAYNNYADILNKMGDTEEAIVYNRDALGIIDANVGSQHPAYGIVSGNLASKLRQQGAVNEAQEIYSEALVVLQNTLPPDHPSTARVKLGLGNCYTDLGLYEQAEPLLLDAFNTFREKNVNVEAARQGLIYLYEAWNMPDKVTLYADLEFESN